MLYLVSTPIGNLGDITFRAIEILKSVDYILCEDTRHSLKLLAHYQIQKPLRSHHKFNEKSQLERILTDLQEGKSIALISDAGTPAISDPGFMLVQACRESGINVFAVPGACAAITALSCSGMDTARFQFYGFLPRKKNELTDVLREFLSYPGTTVCYEAPNRLLKALETLHEIAPICQCCVARELTKKFEEVRKGTPQELLDHFGAGSIKGEIVLMVEGGVLKEQAEWEAMTAQEHVQMMIAQNNISMKEAIKAVAELRGIPKRDLYRTMHID